MRLPTSLTGIALALLGLVCATDGNDWLQRRLDGLEQGNGVHLPLRRQAVRRVSRLDTRADSPATLGLGDYLDVTYSVLVNVGGKDVPLVLDTGSADLWVLSDTCTTCPADHPAFYPQSTSASFNASGLAARLLYGDSLTGTHAYGLVGQDTVSVAQYGAELGAGAWFAAINDTNTSVLDTGCAGIMGMGFPANSVLFNELFLARNPSFSPSKRAPVPRENAALAPASFASRFFPSFPPASQPLSPRALPGSATPSILASYATLAPLFPRLATNRALPAPQFSVALQRDTMQIGGNAGMLSIGALPAGVQEASVTWAKVRGYSASEGGMPPPPDSPGEVYPIAWEVPIDDVFLDGKKLARSTLAPSNVSLSALIDTGSSLIRGPPDVVKSINAALASSSSPPSPSSSTSSSTRFPCASNHTLAFQINGTLFPVDARDLVSQAAGGSTGACVANVVETDVPKGDGSGYLYSWSLGDPFLKGLLTTFYYGNLTYPSVDPPRIGFLSTVPPDHGQQLQSAVASASANTMSDFPATSEPAPSSTPSSLSTGPGGVPQALQSPLSDPQNKSGAGAGSANAARAARAVDVRLYALVAGLTLLGAVL